MVTGVGVEADGEGTEPIVKKATIHSAIAAERILLFFLFVVLAFFGPKAFRGHFWPFIDVLREIWPGVTRKIAKDLRTADYTDPTDWFWAGVRRGGRLQLDV